MVSLPVTRAGGLAEGLRVVARLPGPGGGAQRPLLPPASLSSSSSSVVEAVRVSSVEDANERRMPPVDIFCIQGCLSASEAVMRVAGFRSGLGGGTNATYNRAWQEIPTLVFCDLS